MSSYCDYQAYEECDFQAADRTAHALSSFEITSRTKLTTRARYSRRRVKGAPTGGAHRRRVKR